MFYLEKKLVLTLTSMFVYSDMYDTVCIIMFSTVYIIQYTVHFSVYYSVHRIEYYNVKAGGRW